MNTKKRLNICIDMDRIGIRLLVITILILVLTGSVASAGESPTSDSAHTITSSLQSVSGKYYYLTSALTYDGSEALTACAAGYHMASLWEIMDISNLTYNTTLGASYTDSGQGAPSTMIGWVRTGFVSYNNNDAGRANCNAWTGTGGYGTIINLPYDWTTGTDIGPWEVDTNLCNIYAGVWCIED